ncbi:MAG: tetratricopeptide repeat protein [Methylococcales bacterium]|nr:tetratricopeptide repeat protein [Methylococcales bacterium]
MKRPLFCLISVLIFYSGFAIADTFGDAGAAYVKGDFAQVVNLLRPLAVAGNSEAQYKLGVMYDQGQGVTQDYQQASKWYRLSAEQGKPGAQYNLGVMYAEGQGIVQDYVRSHMWISLAANQGFKEAQGDLDWLAQRMTPAQIIEAQKKMQKCKKSQYKNCN